MTTVTICIGSLHNESVKSSKDAVSMYRYIRKDRYMYKYTGTQIQRNLR